MKYRLKVCSIWEFGQRKDSRGNPHQEDSLFPAHGRQTADDRLFILCDGMGGHDAGEVASATVCEAMSRSILGDGHDREGVFTAEDLTDALEAAYDALDGRDSGAEKKMGTTMTLLKLHSEGATIAHIGDSRVYHIRPGKTGAETEILFETEDHSLVNDLIKVGELTREEARHSRQKNVITRAMQPHMESRPKADVHNTADIKAGDYFYMCSDGMLEQPEMESGESLRNIFSQLGGTDENKVKILESVTENNRDNHTAFIIHILEVVDSAAPMAAVEDATESDDAAGNDNAAGNDMSVPTPVEIGVQKGKGQTASGGNRRSRSNVYRFIVAAVAVALVLIGFSLARSCSNDKNKPAKEKVETSRRDAATPKERRKSSVGNNSPVAPVTARPASGAAPAPEAVTASEDVSAAASAPETNPAPSAVGRPIPLPADPNDPDEIVNSNEQERRDHR